MEGGWGTGQATELTCHAIFLYIERYINKYITVYMTQCILKQHPISSKLKGVEKYSQFHSIKAFPRVHCHLVGYHGEMQGNHHCSDSRVSLPALFQWNPRASPQHDSIFWVCAGSDIAT